VDWNSAIISFPPRPKTNELPSRVKWSFSRDLFVIIKLIRVLMVFPLIFNTIKTIDLPSKEKKGTGGFDIIFFFKKNNKIKLVPLKKKI
jgi:hypothetical protein